MDDIQIVSELKKGIRSVFPEAKVYFYGSRATGNHTEDSDYDILIVLGKITPSIRDKVYDIAWETGFKYDAFISPVLAEKDEMKALSASPFFNNVQQYGLVI